MDLPPPPSGLPGPSSASNGSSNGGSNGGNGGPIHPPPPAPARGDPSKPRRDALKLHEQPPIVLSNMCPISKYYAAADKVFGQFKAHLANMELDEAYIIGRRFALFSTVSLPKHDYYASPRSELATLRLQNQKDAAWVTRGLERIVEVMDKQEIEKQKAEAERARRQKEEEEKKRLEWEESMRQRLGAVESSGLGRLDSKDGALDMAAKLEKLAAKLEKLDGDQQGEEVATPSAPPSEPTANGQLPPLPPPLAPPVIGEPDMALFNSTLAAQQLKSTGGTPLFAEAGPPSYSDLFLDTLRTPPAVTSADLEELERMPTPTAPKPKPAPRTSIRVIQQNCMRQMQSLHNSKQIEIIRLGTFQGRLSGRFDSTNGCAVISPLVVATHIHPQHMQQNQLNHQKFGKSPSFKHGISNTQINDIIDKMAPPILQTVRSKLGLNKHALIIPSDVHDYLVDEQILPQDKFVGVCGGDIMDQTHMKELVAMLVDGREGADAKSKTCRKKRVGAALFFREHVVSIVKIPLANGSCYFDLVDSLPSANAGGMASRTRCKDLASFEVLLRWYASSKFSEANCTFIDNNAWNEGMADFDPRVFQGFVWAE